MSKGKFLTKRKWRNGQRQKGATRPLGNGGHKAPPCSDLKIDKWDGSVPSVITGGNSQAFLNISKFK